MTNILEKKFSDITLEDLKEYLKVQHNKDDLQLYSFLVGAKALIIDLTNRNVYELDKRQHSAIAVYMAASSFYENKTMHIDQKQKVNEVFWIIINSLKKVQVCKGDRR